MKETIFNGVELYFINRGSLYSINRGVFILSIGESLFYHPVTESKSELWIDRIIYTYYFILSIGGVFILSIGGVFILSIGGVFILAEVKDAVFFVDPPYTIASRRLYQYWQVDHRKLFELLSKVKGDVLLTYDNTSEIKNLADKYGFKNEAVAMKNTHHAKMMELLIGRDLNWLLP